MELPPKPTKNESLKGYLKYSGMGFQLVGLMLICYFIGKYLDGERTDKWWTIGLMVFGLIGGMTSVIMKLIREQADNDRK
jgi:ATP synthase protein I